MGRQVPKRADWRVADGVRVEELDGSWLALDPSGGVVYRLEARAAEVMRLVAHRLPVPARLVPAARELAGHGVLAHPFVDRRTAIVGAGIVTLTGLAATLLPSAARAASPLYVSPESGSWPVSGGTIRTQDLTPNDYYVHVFLTSGTLTVADANAITDLSILVVAGGGGGGRGIEGAGGGGGAGGVLTVDGAELANGSYSVTVGTGGAGRSGSSGAGNQGLDSRLNGIAVDLRALGGGRGGGPGEAAATGGSGGGGGADDGTNDFPTGAPVATSGRSGTIGTGTVLFNGGVGGNGANAGTGASAERRAGGGGGAGGDGTSGVRNSTAGAGGGATTLSKFAVTGVDGTFAGGGGGAGGQGSPSTAGGAGGGATAGSGGYGTGSTAIGGDAGANSGSGGGGGTNGQDGGNGGSGIVLVRYRLAP